MPGMILLVGSKSIQPNLPAYALNQAWEASAPMSFSLPGAGWVEYDPTNGLFAGDNLIRVAATRTPEQAITVSGGFVGTIHDALAMEVDVQVTASAPGGG